MNIYNYTNLIVNMPMMQHSETVNRDYWLSKEIMFTWFREMNDRLFGGEEELRICRQDIKETENMCEKIVKSIYWGYPKGGRGNNISNVFKEIKTVEQLLQEAFD